MQMICSCEGSHVSVRRVKAWAVWSCQRVEKQEIRNLHACGTENLLV